MVAPQAPQNSSTLTRLPVSTIRLVRALWLGLAGLTSLLFVLGIPGSYQKASRLTPELEKWLSQTGLPPSFPPNALIAIDILTFALFTSVALFLFWRRSDDWMVLLVAMVLILTAGIYSSPITDAPLPVWLLSFPIGLGEMSQAAFVYLFPDGRFVPKWSRWLLMPMIVWRPLIWILLYMPDYRANFPRLTAQTFGYVQQNPIDIGLFVVCLLIGIGGQIYRYRRLSTPEQRQQAKWVLYGVTMTVVIVSAWVMLFNVFQLGSTDSFVAYLSARIFRQLALAIVPVVFAISILRYRLWDIDFVINRSLVYGVMAIGLLGLFGVLVFILGLVVRPLLGSTSLPVALVMSALAVAALVRPTHKFLSRFVDRRLYGIELDYQQALQAYASRENVVIRSAGGRVVFGPFKDMRLVGRGGMGEVYQTMHPTLKKPVAVKILPPTLAKEVDAVRRFLREAKTLSRLKHPNIIEVIDFGEIDGQPYMVMKYLDGITMSESIKLNGRMPFVEAAQIFKDIARALDYAHQQGVVHRDIKPSNVMLHRRPDKPGVDAILMDFGIAKSETAEGSAPASYTGMLGTLDYIAPEQIHGAAYVDHRADIYSMGVLAFQALTGQLPFRYSNPGALVMAHLFQPPPDPRLYAADISADADYALLRAMSKKPEQRFNSAGEFVLAMHV